MAQIFGGSSSSTPPPPPPPPPAPTRADANDAAKAEAARLGLIRRTAQGRQGTILTGGQGDTTVANTGKQTLGA